jgi:molybdopterin-synthase adenylyltransferase
MEYEAALTESTNKGICDVLLQDTTDEEICFAIWYPAKGCSRYTALIREAIFPEEGDRTRQGTVTASHLYLDRVKEIALQKNGGIAMIHTHPFYPGPPGYSSQDLRLEQNKLAREIHGVTGLPFVGMTLSRDGIWDARIYPDPFVIKNCSAVRIIGKRLVKQYHPRASGKAPVPNHKHMRTASVWGNKKQSDLMRLKAGVIGVGSVGAAVAEILARMGVGYIMVMDYDKLKDHNLDRMPNSGVDDLGSAKIDIVERNMKRAATNDKFNCDKSDYSIVEEEGYRAALDCDVLFSCVDRPWPRQVLNHIAYACLIPVIDGGVSFSINSGKLVHGMFRAQTVGPERACMRCLGSVDATEVQMDRDGNFDDPDYIKELEKTGKASPQRQNIMPFVAGLAGLETIQFVELVTNLGNMGDLGQQPYNYYPGDIVPSLKCCIKGCEYVKIIGYGDQNKPFLSKDKSRMREKSEAN